jgi:hypothetical protein
MHQVDQALFGIMYLRSKIDQLQQKQVHQIWMYQIEERKKSFHGISGQLDTLHRLQLLFGLEMSMVPRQNERVMDSIVLRLYGEII